MKKNLFILFVGALAALTFNSCGNKSEKPVSNSDTLVFNYTPAEPVNGEKKAVVELGASGFNYFAVEIDKDKNWKILKKEFGNSLVSENMTNVNTIKTKLKDYINSILENTGVAGKDIHFVVSSGAQKEKIIEKITDALKQMGYQVNAVTPEQEAEYAFLSTMAKGYEDKSIVVDLGSGNTKISWMENGKINSQETYGAKYFTKNVTDKTAYADVKQKMVGVPEKNCKVMFLIGGVPFKMADMQKKGGERFTMLSTKITDYNELAEKEGDKMKAGLNIYSAILAATDLKQVVFDWDANFAIGFLISMQQ